MKEREKKKQKRRIKGIGEPHKSFQIQKWKSKSYLPINRQYFWRVKCRNECNRKAFNIHILGFSVWISFSNAMRIKNLYAFYALKICYKATQMFASSKKIQWKLSNNNNQKMKHTKKNKQKKHDIIPQTVNIENG